MPKILYLVTEDWFFVSHFLPMAQAARECGPSFVGRFAEVGLIVIRELEKFPERRVAAERVNRRRGLRGGTRVRVKRKRLVLEHDAELLRTVIFFDLIDRLRRARAERTLKSSNSTIVTGAARSPHAGSFASTGTGESISLGASGTSTCSTSPGVTFGSATVSGPRTTVPPHASMTSEPSAM